MIKLSSLAWEAVRMGQGRRTLISATLFCLMSITLGSWISTNKDDRVISSESFESESDPEADAVSVLPDLPVRVQLMEPVSLSQYSNSTGTGGGIMSDSVQQAPDTLDELEAYRRSNSRDPPQCDPMTNVYPCGSLEFIGCSGSKKYYAESIIRLNWFEAWEYCRSHQMHLASIETRYEQSFLELFLPRPESSDKPAYWLSGTDFGREGLFLWMASGKSLTYTNWQRSEPNNKRGREHCIQMVGQSPDFENFQWNDNICTSVAFAICQKEYIFYPERPDGYGSGQRQSTSDSGGSKHKKGPKVRNKVKNPK